LGADYGFRRRDHGGPRRLLFAMRSLRRLAQGRNQENEQARLYVLRTAPAILIQPAQVARKARIVLSQMRRNSEPPLDAAAR